MQQNIELIDDSSEKQFELSILCEGLQGSSENLSSHHQAVTRVHSTDYGTLLSKNEPGPDPETFLVLKPQNNLENVHHHVQTQDQIQADPGDDFEKESNDTISKKKYRARKKEATSVANGRKIPTTKRMQPFAIPGVRQHKSTEQIRGLLKLLRDLKGPINRQVRDRAVELTGLRWTKIYKWMFDLGDKLKVVAPDLKLAPSKSPVVGVGLNALSAKAFRETKIF